MTCHQLESMKLWLISIFCLLFGSTTSNVVPNDKTSVYSYNTVVLSGSPETTQQFAAFGIKCTLKVSWASENQVLLRIIDAKVGRSNGIFHRISPDEIPLKFSESDIYTGNLTRPFVVQFQEDGLIEKIQFDKQETEWSRYFKTGLATMFQMKKMPIRQYISESKDNDRIGSVFQDKEATFSGVCTAIYDYQSWGRISNSMLEINFTKAIDYDTCEDGITPYFGLSTHRAFGCKECNHPQHTLHSDIIYKYNLWVDNQNNYIIREGIADGIVRFTPLGQDADAATVFHNRTLSWQKWTSTDKSSTSRRNEMEWNIPTSDLFKKTQTIREFADLNVPITYYTLFENGVNYIQEIRHGIKKIARLMVGEPSEEEVELILAEIPLVQRALYTVTYPQLEKLAGEFSSKGTERKLFFDLVAMSATNPCIKFILDASTKKLITSDETVELLPTIAAHIANPNVVLMDYMMEFCKSTHVRSNWQLMDTCFLSWGSMVAKTCAPGPYQLPKAPRMFCSKEHRERYVKAVDEILTQIDDEDRIISLLSGLGNMAVQEILPVVEEYMWIRSPRRVWSDVVRVKAIYALIPLAKNDPEWVKESLISVFFNADEETQVRVAAFDVLIASGTRQQMYEKIAGRIQYEEDDTVSAYVYSTFKSLANITHPCWKDISSHAGFALKLMDETHDTSAWIASKTIDEGGMDYLDAHAFRRWLSLGDAGSLAPSRAAWQFENFLGGVTTNLYKVALYANNTSNFIEKLLGPSALFSGKSLMERIANLHVPMSNKGDAQIDEKLGFESSSEWPFWAHIARTFMDFQQRHYFINQDTILNLLASFRKPGDHKWKHLVEKTMMPLDVYIQLPIDSGFDVALIVQTPMQVVLEIETDIKSSQESSRTVFDLEFKLRGHFAAKTVAQLGVIMPAEEATFTVGLESALITNPVIATRAQLAVNKSNLAFSIMSTQPLTSGQDFEVVHYHTKPFTAIEKFYEFKPLTEWAEFIHVMTPKQYQFPLLDNSFVFKVNHEEFWDDRATMFNYWKDNTLYSIATFWWLNAQSVMREYKLIWRSKPMPEFQYEMDWQYEAAKSDPEKRYRNFWYVLWKDVFGWSDAPVDCRFESKSSSSSSKESDASTSAESSDIYSRKLKSPSDLRSSSEESLEGDKYTKTMKSSSSEESHESFFKRVLKYTEESGIIHIPKRIRDSVVEKFSHLRDSKVEVEEGTIGEGVATYWIRAEARLKGSSSVKGFRSEVVWKKHRQDLKKTVKWVVKPVGQAPQRWICLEGEFQDEKPPCLFGNSIPDMSKASLTTKAKLTWGRSCDQPDETIEFWVKAKKSKEQLNPSRRNEVRRPWYFRQCEKDMANNRPMSFACIEKTKELAKLDLIEATVKCSQCSIYNSTEHIRDFLVSQMYAHMSRDPLAVNTKKEMRVVVQFRPHIPVMDIRVDRPQETLNFQQIFYGDWEPWVKRPSVSRTMTHRALNFVSDNTLAPTCTVGSRWVDSFSNDTFRFQQRPDCDFLLSGDSSSSNLFSVLTRQGSDGRKVLTVYQLKNKIEIFPRLTQDVSINGRKFSMKDKSILYIKDEQSGPNLLGFIVRTESLYKVVLTFNRISVWFDGETTQVTTSNLWQHKLHGVCGEFNSEKRNTFKGPRKCIYSNANDFAQTYALPGTSCPAIPLKGEKICKSQSDKSGGRTSMNIPGISYCGHVENDSPYIFKHNPKNAICISEHLIVQCDELCDPRETHMKKIEMRCVKLEDYTPDVQKIFKEYAVILMTEFVLPKREPPFFYYYGEYPVPSSCMAKPFPPPN